MKDLLTGWMTWDDIKPYEEQLIDLELILMVMYHYPDWDIPRSFPEQKVKQLEQHLSKGNTFFWGARFQNILVGYYWAYSEFLIDKKRWYLRSLMVREEFQGMGLGTLAINEGLLKAKNLECDEAVTNYAAFNTTAARAYKKAGYEISRIEVIKKLLR